MNQAESAAMRERLRARSVVNPLTGCWRWMGASRGNGYGAVKVGAKVVDAHRLSWMAFRGPIPAGGMVLHRCDNRSCVNPDHLEIGDAAKNRADAIGRGCVDMHMVNGRARRMVSPLSGDDLSRLLAEYDGGVPLRQLVATFNVPHTSLRRLLAQNGRQLPGGKA